MYQEVKVLAAKSYRLTLIPGIHMVEGEDRFLSVPLISTCVTWLVLLPHKINLIITIKR